MTNKGMQLSITPLKFKGIEYFRADIQFGSASISTTRMSWESCYQWLEKTAHSLVKQIQTDK